MFFIKPFVAWWWMGSSRGCIQPFSLRSATSLSVQGVTPGDNAAAERGGQCHPKHPKPYSGAATAVTPPLSFRRFPWGCEPTPLASGPAPHQGNWDCPQKAVSSPVTTWDGSGSQEMAPKFGPHRVLPQVIPLLGAPTGGMRISIPKFWGKNEPSSSHGLEMGPGGTPGVPTWVPPMAWAQD